MSKQDVRYDAGGDSGQYKVPVYPQPVVAGRRRVQTVPVPVVDNVSGAVVIIVPGHDVPGANVAMSGMPGI